MPGLVQTRGIDPIQHVGPHLLKRQHVMARTWIPCVEVQAFFVARGEKQTAMHKEPLRSAARLQTQPCLPRDGKARSKSHGERQVTVAEHQDRTWFAIHHACLLTWRKEEGKAATHKWSKRASECACGSVSITVSLLGLLAKIKCSICSYQLNI